MMLETRENSLNGMLLVDKEAGITSYDVIRMLKRAIGTGSKIGHAGTLDPFATGLLVILLGSATKTMNMFHAMRKRYCFTLELGYETDTLDPTGKVINRDDTTFMFSKEQIDEVLIKFIGEQLQTPPQFSAKKVNGKRAYELARRGETQKLEPKLINIYELKVIEFSERKLKLDCIVSSGTYIRQLAADIGRELGTYATTVELRRTSIGGYTLDHAIPSNGIEKADIVSKLLPIPKWENVT